MPISKKNMPITFHLRPLPQGMLLSFILDRPLVPGDLRELQPPDFLEHDFARKGVIISGRGPVWLYGFLVHFYHPCRFVAVHDPRLNGAVVVEAHVPDLQPGDLIQF